MPRVDLAPRWSRRRAAVFLAFCGFALLGWQGLTTLGHDGAIDAGEHLRYAQYLAEHHRLPPAADNYEYSSPPLFQATAVVAESIVRAVPAVRIELSSNLVTHALWFALAALGASALTVGRRRVRIGGSVALGAAGLWGLDEAVILCHSEHWTAGQLIALGSGMGLIGVTGLIARELWPDHPGRALAAAGFAAAYPVVYRMSILFHPEAPFALICGIALLVFLRSARRGFPPRLGFALGAVCGVAALTRQPAVVLIACLGAAAFVVGGRGAVPFVVRGALVVALLAGPWWIYAAHRWHNPIQSNLNRPGRMLSSEPFSFYVSAPIAALVVHPFRPNLTNELLPQLHSELWSDWVGALHQSWSHPTKIDRVTASTQSVLGLVADVLALAGLGSLAVPAGIRVLRRGSRTPADVGLGVLALVGIVAFVLFVVTLIRFPQRDGDPIKSSYLLFTTPCWALFSVAAWIDAARRWRHAGRTLAVVAFLYGASYGTMLGSALAESGNGRPATGVDLAATFQQNSPNPGIGGPIEFLAGVQDNGLTRATGVTMQLSLPAAMKLLGPPFASQGSCTGETVIRCNFGNVAAAGGQAYIRFSVGVDAGGAQTMMLSAASQEPDARPSDNESTFTVNLGPA